MQFFRVKTVFVVFEPPQTRLETVSRERAFERARELARNFSLESVVVETLELQGEDFKRVAVEEVEDDGAEDDEAEDE
jgi:hypothetical protein